MIQQTFLIVNPNAETFLKQVQERVDDIQAKGHRAEVQYGGTTGYSATTTLSFSAMVIGHNS